MSPAALARLSPATLARAAVPGPSYDRAGLRRGIVHLGLGNFARAHLCAYLERCLPSEPDWAVTGISLRRPDMAHALGPQSGLYTLAERGPEGQSTRILGAVASVIPAAERPAAALEALAAPDTRIVTVTVTEKGYCRGPDGGLDLDDAAVRADLAQGPDQLGHAPKSLPGLLVAACARRLAAGHDLPSLVSLDNLPGNGRVLSQIVTDFAETLDPALAAAITARLVCPNSMVDRIVPATTDADRVQIARETGLWDAAPVITEPFCQWVLEDRFPLGRPDLAAAGVTMVAGAAPYEQMKLRMLNGAHSALAYGGLALGLTTVADAIADARLAALTRGVMREAAPTVPLPQAELADYAEALIARFENPALVHQTAQIAQDGSQKVPLRLVAPLADLAATGATAPAIELAIALWVRHTVGGPMSDPMAAELAAIAARHPAPADHVRALLAHPGLFGALAPYPAVQDRLASCATAIADQGAAALLAAFHRRPAR